MKIWIKYLTGILIGMAFALIAPDKNAAFTGITEFLTRFFVQAGRYALYPVLFFSITLSVYEHRENRTLFRIGWHTALVIVASTVGIALLGLVSVLIANPARIPIFVEGSSDIENVITSYSIHYTKLYEFRHRLFLAQLPAGTSHTHRENRQELRRQPPDRREKPAPDRNNFV